MARILYGAGTADVVAVVSTDDGDYAPPANAAIFDVYDAFTAGSAVTDLLDISSSPITQVTNDVDGRILFYGPDGTTGPLWLQDSSDPSATRFLVNPSDLASRVSAVAAVTSVAGRTGDVVLVAADVTDATVTGKALMSAATAAAARTTLGVTPTSSLAAVATSGALGDLTGELGYAQLIPGAVLFVAYDDVAVAWPNTGARPTARTDVLVMWVGGTEADPPTGAITGDIWHRPA